jgi:hypothetical protein
MLSRSAPKWKKKPQLLMVELLELVMAALLHHPLPQVSQPLEPRALHQPILLQLKRRRKRKKNLNQKKKVFFGKH